MRMQQHVPARIAYRIGEILVVLPQRDDTPGLLTLFTVQDIEHGEREKTLGGLLKGAVEDLVHLVANLLRRRHGGNAPQERNAKSEPQRDPPLQAARRRHAPRPSR